ncbi:MAG: flagellar protein FlaG [Clostridiales bacterium]|uniref:flagellar protein FlaG n=1 Tax=Roseburia sp. MSJ-14 TaxID=2841514 RepID=UPI001690F098|nr:flagellar protein FlaG [Roseburia sp. MSJ-14]MBU5474803.1 flagellar protein FlaG [Roseburia sp. MSJ-14]NLK78895.1 flagellar protein FlaG [Clostridiales bacterium]
MIDGVKNAGMAYQGSSQSSSSVETTSSVESSDTQADALKENSTAKWNKQELNIDDGKDASENKMTSPTEALKKAVEEINKNATNSEVVFGIHEATNRMTIKIVDKDSRKVIKEYPPEKTLDMIAKVWELAGLLVDEKG